MNKNINTYHKEYDEYGNLVYQVHSRKNIYKIDDEGYKDFLSLSHRIKYVNHIGDMAIDTFLDSTTYKYNDKNDIESLTSIHLDCTCKHQKKIEYFYAYDDDGKILKKTITHHSYAEYDTWVESNEKFYGDPPSNTDIIFYEYDASGHVIKETRKRYFIKNKEELNRYFELEPIDIEEITFNNIYNEQGQIIEIIGGAYNNILERYEYENDKISKKYIYEYHYLCTEDNKKGYSNYKIELYFYNNKDKLFKTVLCNEKLTPMKVVTYDYLYEDRPTVKEVSPMGDNMRWHVTGIYEFSISLKVDEEIITPQMLENMFKYCIKVCPRCDSIRLETESNDTTDRFTYYNELESIINKYNADYGIKFDYNPY